MKQLCDKKCRELPNYPLICCKESGVRVEQVSPGWEPVKQLPNPPCSHIQLGWVSTHLNRLHFWPVWAKGRDSSSEVLLGMWHLCFWSPATAVDEQWGKIVTIEEGFVLVLVSAEMWRESGGSSDAGGEHLRAGGG